MDKSALRSFATNARRELLDKVKAKAMKIGITEEKIKKADVESSDAVFIDGRQLSIEEKSQRKNLIKKVEQNGFNQVMEEVAYTWFNRFTALRFMEVNEYLPSNVRVLSSSNPEDPIPDIIKEALTLDFDIDKEWVYERKVKNENDKLLQYLIIKQCNDLYDYMPFMFEKIDDYSEILYPEGLLLKDSFIRKMTDTNKITEADWGNVEIIGWLYQYYIAEEKDRVFKAKRKFKVDEIPFATQLFTPEWIVRYMVQNSLGRYWIENHSSDEDLKNNWMYYIDNFGSKANKASISNKDLQIEEIKCFDPAMGSGHILIAFFEVLYEIYSKCGYSEREIPKLIIEKNLFGLEIDKRAYQLACFSVVMKAMEYQRGFIRRIKKSGLKINLAVIEETNKFTEDHISYLAGEDKGPIFDEISMFVRQFENSKAIGSLTKLSSENTQLVQKRLDIISNTDALDLFESEKRDYIISLVPSIIKQADIMKNKYDVLVTNPPYMSSGTMNAELYNYLKKRYPDSKLDVFGAFMELNHYLLPNAYYACINQHSWMFLSSFERLREKITKNMYLQSMLHLGPRAFEEISGEVVQSTTFVMKYEKSMSRRGTYINLIEEKTSIRKKKKLLEFLNGTSESENIYQFDQLKVSGIPGFQIAYWLDDQYFNLFNNYKTIGSYVEAKAGVVTGNDKYFVRLWHEINFNDVEFLTRYNKQSYGKYHLMAKGGSHRRYYGNNDYVIKLRDLWDDTKTNRSVRRGDKEYYFKRAVGWSQVGNAQRSFRIVENSVCGTATPTIYPNDEKYTYYFLAFLNSKVAYSLLNIFNQTMNLLSTDICNLPIIIDEEYVEKINELSISSIEISKYDWNSKEGSWGFKTHPFIKHKRESTYVADAFRNWNQYSNKLFEKMKYNEEELNRIFIDIYNLNSDLSPKVGDKQITIGEIDVKDEVKSFISYAVGCMFGRYSLDHEGLVYGGGQFSYDKYHTFKADKDNILPILPGAYFEDDIVTRFVDFVRLTFGEQSLMENLNFLAESLGKKKNETNKETIRRYFINDFFKDHVNVYKKRPIYWMFTSGKQKVFNCLIYIHRYDETTLGRIRTDYLHELQTRMDAEKESLLRIIDGDSTQKEITHAKKELKLLEKKIEELKDYDEVLHHMADQQIEIDLDDGVEVNYEKFKSLLAKK